MIPTLGPQLRRMRAAHEPNAPAQTPGLRRRSRRVERWLGRVLLALLLGLTAVGWVQVLGWGGAGIAFAATAVFVLVFALALRPLVEMVFSQHRQSGGHRQAGQHSGRPPEARNRG